MDTETVCRNMCSSFIYLIFVKKFRRRNQLLSRSLYCSANVIMCLSDDYDLLLFLARLPRARNDE